MKKKFSIKKEESPLKHFHSKQWVIMPQVPNELYTDRLKHLDFLYKQALQAARKRAKSTVLLGQRRMGKTEIFNRVVNRLFWEQDHTDPEAVVPVHYRFLDRAMPMKQFCESYVENFLRWWSAFRLRDPSILGGIPIEELEPLIQKKLPKTLSEKVKDAFRIFEGLRGDKYPIPQDLAIKVPQLVAEFGDQTIVMFLDEFQNTHLPQYDFQIVGCYQPVVESLKCPHFVTGSAMTILSREILGTGALFGRFQNDPIGELTPYHGNLLAQKAAAFHNVYLPKTMAPVVSDRCGGNPFYITAVIRQAENLKKPLGSEAALDKILAVDLSSGFIWAELNDQVTRWIERINDYGITKWVLYLSALGEDEFIDPKRIQHELKERDNQEVELSQIRDILIKLSRGDLLEYLQLGNSFRKIEDPILIEFLKVWGRIEVERQKRGRVIERLEFPKFSLKKRIHDHLGYLAEIYMTQVLWNSQDQTLPGELFHQEEDIQMPSHFIYIDQRRRLKSGKNREIDIVAAAGEERWLCESKWWRKKKVGKKEIEILLENGILLNREDEIEKMPLVHWFFAHEGFTKEAEKFMTKNHVLWSTREDLDQLLDFVGLRLLPDL